MSPGSGVVEVVVDELVEVISVVQTVLVVEPVQHAPAPRLHQVFVILGQFLPELDESLGCVHFISSFVLTEDVRVDSPKRYARNDLVLGEP